MSSGWGGGEGVEKKQQELGGGVSGGGGKKLPVTKHDQTSLNRPELVLYKLMSPLHQLSISHSGYLYPSLPYLFPTSTRISLPPTTPGCLAPCPWPLYQRAPPSLPPIPGSVIVHIIVPYYIVHIVQHVIVDNLTICQKR